MLLKELYLIEIIPGKEKQMDHEKSYWPAFVCLSFDRVFGN